ncbi:MAG: hypothetical protein JNM63_10130, partial [Spirochaetia bacterium]|nr:hypothetical protein [Spirochaetia bacterium]
VQSECVTLWNITAYTSPNTVFSGVRVSEYNVLYCKLLRKNGRLLTSNADTLTVFSYGRAGLWVEGCHFESALDDVMQPEGFKCAIDSLVDDHRLKVRGLKLEAVPDAVLPGDTLLLFNAREAAPLWEGKVASVDPKNNLIAFAGKLPDRGIIPVDVKNGGDLTLLYNKDASTAFFVIRSNTFSNTIGNTLVSHVPKAGGIFEGNILVNTTMGVNFANHASWTYYAGYPKEIYLRIASNAQALGPNLYPDPPVFTENILIRGNQFIGGYASPKTYKENMGAVSFFLYGGAWKLPARTIGYSNLAITRNQFLRHPGKYAVRIHNASSVLIEDNHFDTGLASEYAGAFAAEERFAIGLAYSSDIEIRGNKTSDPKSLLFVGEDVQRVQGPGPSPSGK